MYVSIPMTTERNIGTSYALKTGPGPVGCPMRMQVYGVSRVGETRASIDKMMDMIDESLFSRDETQEFMFSTTHHTNKCQLKKIVTSSALILIDDDMVKTYFHPEVEVTDESAEENFDAIWDDVKDRPYYSLVVPDMTTQISLDVRNYENDALDGLKRAEALVIRSLAHRILAKFYLKGRKDRFPTKVVDTEAEALLWFEELREKALN